MVQDPVADDKLLLRAVRQGRTKVYDPNTNIVSPRIFDPRPNETGVSVDVVISRDPQVLVIQAKELARTFKVCNGIFTLETYLVRQADVRLDVFHAVEEGKPNHAVITGIPHDDTPDSIGLREYLTRRLARIATELMDEQDAPIVHKHK